MNAAAERTDWLARHTAQAPPRLERRMAEYLAAVPEGTPLPDALARAGCDALTRVAAHPGDRSIALDLLAADGLVTLALLAQAERSPAELAAFARALFRREPDPA